MASMTETPRNRWPFMQWNSNWQAWQQKFEDLVKAQDATVFGNMESSKVIFKQLPNAEIIDNAGAKELSMASDLVLVSRTLNVAIEVDSSSNLVLGANQMIGLVATPGAVGVQSTVLELYDSVDIDPSIQILGYVDENFAINWFNGSRLQEGESARQIFSFLVAAGTETNKVMATAADTTPNFLGSKLATDGSVVFTTLNPGANEQIELSVPGVGTDKYVSVSATDTTPGYLDDKLVVGAGLQKSILNSGGDEDVQLVWGDDNTILVNRGTTPAQAGTNLLAAYAAAKATAPTSDARIKLVLWPGEYEMSTQLIVDTDYIDIVCEEEARQTQWGASPIANNIKKGGAVLKQNPQVTDTVSVRADDVVLRGLHFHCDNTSVDPCDTLHTISGGFYGRYCRFIGCSFESGVWGFRQDERFDGYMEECHGDSHVGSSPSMEVFGGSALRCTAVESLLSGEINGAGIEDCNGGNWSFAGAGAYDIIDSHLRGCRSWGATCFAIGSLTGSLMVDCHMLAASSHGFGYVGADYDTMMLGCTCAGMVNPMGSNGSGWAGKMHGCRIYATSTNAAVHLKAGFDVQNSAFRTASGRSHAYPNRTLISYDGSVQAGRVSGCYVEMGWDEYISLDQDFSFGNDAPPAPNDDEIVLHPKIDADGNWAQFYNALQWAITLTPNGAAKSAGNRVTVRLGAGVYNAGAATGVYNLILDSTCDFIDVVGVGEVNKDNWDSIPVQGDIHGPQTIITGDSDNGLIQTNGVSDMRWQNIRFVSTDQTSSIYMGKILQISNGTDNLDSFEFENCVFESNLKTVNIIAITQANPAVVTVDAAHNFSALYSIADIQGVGGMVEISDGGYKVKQVDSTRFQIVGLDSTGFTPFTSGGTVTVDSGSNYASVYTDGEELGAKFRNCHFIGSIVTSGQEFRGEMRDVSIVGRAPEYEINDAYIENVRVSSIGFSSSGGFNIGAGTVIKNAKLWGYYGFGHSGGVHGTLEDVEFFGGSGLGANTGSSTGVMRRVKALNLGATLTMGAGLEIDDCDFTLTTDSTLLAFRQGGVTVASLSYGPLTTVITSSPHGFKVGDRVGFNNFGSGGGGEEMNHAVLEVVAVGSTVAFDVVNYGSNFSVYSGGGWVGPAGTRITNSRLRNTMSPYQTATSSSVIDVQTSPGVIAHISGCVIGPDKCFPNVGYFTLDDCTSYDNDCVLPHLNETEVLVKKMGEDPIWNGWRLWRAYEHGKLMTPKGQPLAADNRVTVKVPCGVFALGDIIGVSYIDPADYVDLAGTGVSRWKKLGSGVPSTGNLDEYIIPETKIIARSTFGCISIGVGIDIQISGLHLDSGYDSTGSGAWVKPLVLLGTSAETRFRDIFITNPVGAAYDYSPSDGIEDATFEDVHVIGSFLTFAIWTSGVVKRCTATAAGSFGRSMFAGYAEDCAAPDSFGRDAPGVWEGAKLVRCISSGECFGVNGYEGHAIECRVLGSDSRCFAGYSIVTGAITYAGGLERCYIENLGAPLGGGGSFTRNITNCEINSTDPSIPMVFPYGLSGLSYRKFNGNIIQHPIGKRNFYACSFDAASVSPATLKYIEIAQNMLSGGIGHRIANSIKGDPQNSGPSNLNDAFIDVSGFGDENHTSVFKQNDMDSLRKAYERARRHVPGGLALSASNRVTLRVPPGDYDCTQAWTPAARVVSTWSGTVTAGMTMGITVDGGGEQTVTIPSPSVAGLLQFQWFIAKEINSQLTGNVVCYYRDGEIAIESTSCDGTGSVQVTTAGTLNAILNFPLTLESEQTLQGLYLDADYVDIECDSTAGRTNWKSIPVESDIVKPKARIYGDSTSYGIGKWLVNVDATDLQLRGLYFEDANATAVATVVFINHASTQRMIDCVVKAQSGVPSVANASAGLEGYFRNCHFIGDFGYSSDGTDQCTMIDCSIIGNAFPAGYCDTSGNDGHLKNVVCSGKFIYDGAFGFSGEFDEVLVEDCIVYGSDAFGGSGPWNGTVKNCVFYGGKIGSSAGGNGRLINLIAKYMTDTLQIGASGIIYGCDIGTEDDIKLIGVTANGAKIYRSNLEKAAGSEYVIDNHGGPAAPTMELAYCFIRGGVAAIVNTLGDGKNVLIP